MRESSAQWARVSVRSRHAKQHPELEGARKRVGWAWAIMPTEVRCSNRFTRSGRRRTFPTKLGAGAPVPARQLRVGGAQEDDPRALERPRPDDHRLESVHGARNRRSGRSPMGVARLVRLGGLRALPLGLLAPDARHSRNLAARPEVAIAIFDSTVPVGGAPGRVHVGPGRRTSRPRARAAAARSSGGCRRRMSDAAGYWTTFSRRRSSASTGYGLGELPADRRPRPRARHRRRPPRARHTGLASRCSRAMSLRRPNGPSRSSPERRST